jgi:hypothetical protein
MENTTIIEARYVLYAQNPTDNLIQQLYIAEEIVQGSGFNPIPHTLPTLVDKTIIGALHATISSAVQLS